MKCVYTYNGLTFDNKKDLIETILNGLNILTESIGDASPLTTVNSTNNSEIDSLINAGDIIILDTFKDYNAVAVYEQLTASGSMDAVDLGNELGGLMANLQASGQDVESMTVGDVLSSSGNFSIKKSKNTNMSKEILEKVITGLKKNGFKSIHIKKYYNSIAEKNNIDFAEASKNTNEAELDSYISELEQILTVKNQSQTRREAEAISTVMFDGVDITTSELIDYLDGAKYFVMNKIMEGLKPSTNSLDFKEVYDYVKESIINHLTTRAGNKFIAQNTKDRIANHIENLFNNEKNFMKFVNIQKNTLKQFKTETTKDLFEEIESSRENTFDSVAFEFDTKDMLPPIIKMYIAATRYTKTDAKGNVLSLKNDTGFDRLGDFSVKYNTIAKVLANTPSDLELMMDKLEKFYIDEAIGDRFSFVKEMYEDLKKRIENVKQGKDVKDNMDFLVKFVQSFSKHTPQFYIHNLMEGANSIQSQTIMRHKTRMKSEMLNGVKAMFKKEDKDLLDKDQFMTALQVAASKLQSLQYDGDKLSYYKTLNDIFTGLGLNLNGLNVASLDAYMTKHLSSDERNWDQQLYLATVFNHMPKNMDIFESGVGALQYKVLPAMISFMAKGLASKKERIKGEGVEYKPLAQLLRKDQTNPTQLDIAAKKFFDRFIDAHYNTTSETPDNQFQSASGKPNYGVVLNHQISDSINELNQFATGKNRKERMANLFRNKPKFQSGFLENNKLLNVILDKGLEIEIAYQNGITTGDKGKLVKNMDAVEKWYTTIDFVDNDYMILPRAADRTVENVFRLKNPDGSTHNVFGDSSKDYTTSMMNILAQEIYDAINVRRNVQNGKMINISNFNKNYVKKIEAGKYTDALVMFNSKSGRVSPEVSKSINELIKRLDNNISLDNIKAELKSLRDKIDSNLSEYLKTEAKNILKKMESDGAMIVLQGSPRPLGIPKKAWDRVRENLGIDDTSNRRLSPDTIKAQTEMVVLEILRQHVAKSEPALYEVNSLFLGSIHYFKNADDYFKRVKPFNGTKKNSVNFELLNSTMNNENYVVVNGKKITKKNANTTENKAILTKIITGDTADLKFGTVGEFFDPDRLLNDDFNGDMKSVILNDVDVYASLLLVPGKSPSDSKKILNGISQIEKINNKFVINGDSNTYDTLPEFVRYLIDELYNKDGVTNKIVLATKTKSFLTAYMKMTEMDGESYMTLPAYKETLVRSGDWTEGQEILYKKLITNQELTLSEAQEVSTYFRKLKTLATGHLNKADVSMGNDPGTDFDRDALYVPSMYKHSIMPLIPQLVNKDSILGKLSSFMMKKGMRAGIYDSANKVGAILDDKGDRVTIYDSNGDLALDENTEYTTQTIPFVNIGIQVELKPVMKEKSTVGSQLRKLIISNMVSNGVFQDYKGTKEQWDALSEPAKRKASEMYRMSQDYIETQNSLYQQLIDGLIDELNLSVINNKYILSQEGLEKIVSILTEMSADRGQNENILQTIQRFTDPNVTLEYLSDPSRIEPVLYAIINNRIIKEKRTGIGAPQTAVTGWEVDKRDVKLSNNGILKFYRLNHDKSSILPAEIYYQIPGGYDTLTKLNSYYKKLNNTRTDYSTEQVLDLVNKDLDALYAKLSKEEEQGAKVTYTDFEKGLKKLIGVVGFRIPTQGFNSADNLRIRKFLNPIGGDTLVVPSEIVAKAGSDFDIDKMTLYLANFKLDDTGFKFYDFDNDDTAEGKQRRYDKYVAGLKLTEDELQKQDELVAKKLKVKNTSIVSSLLKNELTKDVDLVKIDKAIAKILKNNAVILPELLTSKINKTLDSLRAEVENGVYNKDNFGDYEEEVQKLISTIQSEIDNALDNGTAELGLVLMKLLPLLNSRLPLFKSKLNNEKVNEELTKIKEAREEAKLKILKERSNFISKAEYDKKPLLEVNTQKQLEDRMLSLHQELMSSKFNYRLLISPITDDLFKDSEIGAVWDIRFLQSGSSHVKKYLTDKAKFLVENGLLQTSNGKDIPKTSPVTSSGEIKVGNTPISRLLVKKMNDEQRSKYEDEIGASYQENKLKFVDEYNSDGDPSNAFRTTTNISKFTAFLSGKAGVGQAAVHVTHHQLALAVNLRFKNYPLTFVFPHNTFVESNGVTVPTLGKSTDVEGNLISETLSGIVNSYVDVAKDPYIFDLNAGNDNANLQFMLIRLGVPYGWISKFLSQPAVKAYQKQIRQHRNELARGRSFESNEKLFLRAMYELTNDDKYITVVDENGGIVTDKGGPKTILNNPYVSKDDISNMMRKLQIAPTRVPSTAKIARKLEAKGITYEMLTNTSDSNTLDAETLGEIDALIMGFPTLSSDIDPANFTEEILENQLGNFDSKSESSSEFQKNILMLYLLYQSASSQLQLLMRATNQDSKGVGKNRNSIRSSDLNRLRAYGSRLFNDSWQDIYTKTIVNKPYNVVANITKIYDDKILFESVPELKFFKFQVEDRFKNQLTEEELDKLSTQMVSRFVATMDNLANPNFYTNTFESLLIDSPKNKYYFNGEKVSLPRFIAIAKISTEKDLAAGFSGNPQMFKLAMALRKNNFIKATQIQISDNQVSSFKELNSQYYTLDGERFNRIDFNRQNIDASQASVHIAALNQLKEEYPDFYNDLVSYARISNGFKGSNNSFNSLIDEETWFKIKNDAIEYYLDNKDDLVVLIEMETMLYNLTEGEVTYDGIFNGQAKLDKFSGEMNKITTTRSRVFLENSIFRLAIPLRVGGKTSYVTVEFIPDLVKDDRGQVAKDFKTAINLKKMAYSEVDFDNMYDFNPEENEFGITPETLNDYIARHPNNFKFKTVLSSNIATFRHTALSERPAVKTIVTPSQVSVQTTTTTTTQQDEQILKAETVKSFLSLAIFTEDIAKVRKDDLSKKESKEIKKLLENKDKSAPYRYFESEGYLYKVKHTIKKKDVKELMERDDANIMPFSLRNEALEALNKAKNDSCNL